VNFEHRPWWYGGHFCQKQEKIWKKKLFPIGKNEWVGENGGKKVKKANVQNSQIGLPLRYEKIFINM